MGAHGLPAHVCPYCLKRFETRQGVEAHQKSKRHTVADRQEGGNIEKMARRYDHDRRAQIKAERAALQHKGDSRG